MPQLILPSKELMCTLAWKALMEKLTDVHMRIREANLYKQKDYMPRANVMAMYPLRNIVTLTEGVSNICHD